MLVLLALVVAGLTCVSCQPFGNEFVPPPVLHFNDSRVTHRFFANYKKITIKDGRNGNATVVSFTTRVYCKDGLDGCFLPSYTFFMWPNIHAKVLLCNNMTGMGAEILNDTDVVNWGYTPYKDQDVINLHTHGLHVNPNEDNVVTRWQNPFCPPGWTNATNNGSSCIVANSTRTNYDCQLYDFLLPEYHYPGIHWWHTHQHGSVAFQVAGGMYGGIQVADGRPGVSSIYNDPSSWENNWIFVAFQFISKTCDCTSVKQRLQNHPQNLSTTPVITGRTGFPIPSRCTITCLYSQRSKDASGIDLTTFVNDSYVRPNQTGVIMHLVNGQYKPTRTIVTNKWYHWKIVDVTMVYLFLKFDNYSNCDVFLTGSDGIEFANKSQGGTGPRDVTKAPYWKTIPMSIGNRADVLMRCKNPGRIGLWTLTVKPERQGFSSNFSKPNKDALNVILNQTNDCLDDITNRGFTIPTGPFDDMIMDFRIKETGGGTATQQNEPIPYKPTKPYSTCLYLKDTLNLRPDEYTTDTSPPINRGPTAMQTMNLVLPAKPFVKANLSFHATGMNNVSYSEHIPLFTFQSSTVHEWTVFIRFHPYHHHTWPFQVQSSYPNLQNTLDNTSTGWWVRKGDWRDVMGLYGSLIVRVNYVAGGPQKCDFETGKLVMHCHFVFHEDFGMMAWFQLSTAAQPRLTFTPANEKFTLLTNAPRAIGGSAQKCFMNVNQSNNIYVTGRVNVHSKTLQNWFSLEFGQIGMNGANTPQNCYGVYFRGSSRPNVENFFVTYNILTPASVCTNESGIGLRLQAFVDSNGERRFQAVPVSVRPPYPEAPTEQLQILNLLCDSPTIMNNAGNKTYNYTILCFFGLNATGTNQTLVSIFRATLNELFTIKGSKANTQNQFQWSYGEGLASSHFPGYAGENVQSCPLYLQVVTAPNNIKPGNPFATESNCTYDYFNLVSNTSGPYVSRIYQFPNLTPPCPTGCPPVKACAATWTTGDAFGLATGFMFIGILIGVGIGTLLAYYHLCCFE